MSTPRDPDEQYADRLREVLRAEADQVIPGGDGLMRIRERVGERRVRNRWLVPAGVAAAAALVAGGVAGGLSLAGNDDNSSSLIPVGSPSASTPTGAPTNVQTPPPPATTKSVPVYYLADTGTAIRLYREFHRVDVTSGSSAFAAVDAMLHTPAIDSDYTSLWPSKTAVRKIVYNVDHSVASIEFSKDVNGPFNGGTEAAQQTIQQLVWTLTGADNAVKSVLIQVDGKPVTSLFGIDVSKPQKRGLSYEVLGAVWVLAPTQGATVSSPVRFSGQATVFEANVSIEIMRGATVVKRTHTTATIGGPGRGDWKITIALPPGTYEIRAFESSAQDGSVTNLDDKNFTVR